MKAHAQHPYVHPRPECPGCHGTDVRHWMGWTWICWDCGLTFNSRLWREGDPHVSCARVTQRLRELEAGTGVAPVAPGQTHNTGPAERAGAAPVGEAQNAPGRRLEAGGGRTGNERQARMTGRPEGPGLKDATGERRGA